MTNHAKMLNAATARISELHARADAQRRAGRCDEVLISLPLSGSATLAEVSDLLARLNAATTDFQFSINFDGRASLPSILLETRVAP